jgi:polyisoprenoid-binding protein YceI
MRDERITAVNAWINPASVETGLPELDTALESDEFFAVEAHPRATFDGDRVDASGDTFIAHGTLEVKGIRKPIDVPFQLVRQGDGHHVRGRFEIHRLDFEVGTGEWADTQWIANVTTVTFEGTLRGPVAR